MSYDLHITKSDIWMDSDKNPITDNDLEKVSDLLNMYKGVPFIYREGRLTLSRADHAVIGLMIQIAERLDAKVQGDEGEYYSNEDNKYPPPPEYLKQDSNALEFDITDQQKQYIQSLGINDEVHHRKYGTGQIIHISGEGMNTEFTVQFVDRDKPRRLLAYYSPFVH